MQDNIQKAFGDYELDWDSAIENDSTFELLPEGDCLFEVLSFARGRHNGSAKLPPCGKAILKIRLTSQDTGKQTTIEHNLFLHSTTEGMLCAFFTAIGQRKRGQRIQMNWNAVPGAKGRCHVTIRDWTSNNGNKMQSNQISKFYEPEEPVQTQNAAFTPGQF